MPHAYPTPHSRRDTTAQVTAGMRRMSTKSVLPLLLAALMALASFPALAQAQSQAPSRADVVDTATMERVGTMGFIDWPGQRAAAVGHGAPPQGAYNAAQARAMAHDTALFVARSNLMEVLRQIRVDAGTRMGDLLRADPRAEERIRRLADAAPIASERTLAGGMVRLILVLPLTGDVAQEISAMTGKRSQPEPKAPPAPKPAEAAPQVATGSAPEPTAADAALLAPAAQALAASATGLIVDARGAGFTPTLRPRLMHGDEVVYPSPGVDHAVGTRQGYVRYYRDLAQAQQSDPAGTAPYTVHARAHDGGPGPVRRGRRLPARRGGHARQLPGPVQGGGGLLALAPAPSEQFQTTLTDMQCQAAPRLRAALHTPRVSTHGRDANGRLSQPFSCLPLLLPRTDKVCRMRHKTPLGPRSRILHEP